MFQVMHVLHLTFYNSHTTLSDPLTTQNWITVLELAAPGGNPNIRDQTIHHLTIVTIKDPILCPYFAWFENVPSWFVPAVSVLARRAELLTKLDITGTQDIHPDRLMALNPGIPEVRESVQHLDETLCLTINAPQVRVCLKHGYAESTHCLCLLKTATEKRATRDFTQDICRVFECDETGFPNNLPVPKPDY
jgi:hypothetical protein